MGKLTDQKIKNAKPGPKPQKLSDGEGLHLYITTKGQKYWRYSYRFAGKQKTLSLGVYPAVGLKDARKARQDAKGVLTCGDDPGFVKKIEKGIRGWDTDNDFANIATEWALKQTWSDSYRTTQQTRLDKDILPFIGQRPIDQITAREILITCKRVEDRGAIETAHKVKRICSQVFRYALGLGLVESDPARDLKQVLAPVDTMHRAALTDPKDVGGLMRAIHGFTGTPIVRAVLLFSIYTFPRPFEARHAEWSEVDFDAAMWRIPGEKMKMKRLHIVPLSRQAVQTLKEIHPLTGNKQYIFPGTRDNGKVISENTANASLRRLGFTQTEQTHHGFRATASTLLHELGWATEIIEMQLSHVDKNEVRRAYNHAKYLPQRTEMMQAWADYLDELSGK